MTLGGVLVTEVGAGCTLASIMRISHVILLASVTCSTLSIVRTQQTLVSIVLIHTLGVFVARALDRTIPAHISKTTPTLIRTHTHPINTPPLTTCITLLCSRIKLISTRADTVICLYSVLTYLPALPA